MKRRYVPILAAVLMLPGIPARGAEADEFLEIIHTPTMFRAPRIERPVLVAIVDDSVRVTHQDLQPLVWRNPKEIPGNRVDDDGNGFVDDVSGWDIADGDADVMPAEGREEMFYHGSHMAGIVARIARQAYGADAPKWIRILPVKCLEDDADKPYLKQGFKGIQYASDMGADIILTAWGVPEAGSAEMRILQSASDRGAVIVAPAGNFNEEREQYPAAFPPALAVTSVDSTGAKVERATYGSFVDLVAPGTGIVSAGAGSDTAQAGKSGTSMAAAVVAGVAAVIKSQHPEATADEVAACLKNTAKPVESCQSGDIYYGGKLGAGLLDFAAAIDLSLEDGPEALTSARRNHQGYLVSYHPHEKPATWRIRPDGKVSGFWFEPKYHAEDPGESRLKLFQENPADGEPFLDVKLKDWNERSYVPGEEVRAVLERDPACPDFNILIGYASNPINQSTLYCRGTVQVKTEGIIEDGSGPENYSPRTDGKWLITAPVGKVVHVEFLEFDTEAKMDWVYFFNGAGTHEKIMAVCSGPEIPPELTSWRNQALLWFVTDDQRQGKGWKARVTFRDPVPVASE